MIVRRLPSKLTLNRLFLLIIAVGFFCLTFIGYVLLKEERDNAIKKWQMNTSQRSSSATSSYYAGLITNLVLGNNESVQGILNIARPGENLLSISIVPQSNITMYILETCEVDNNQSFFHQVPTCIEYADNSLFIYHELRSTGYNLGYLKKEVALPHFGLFDNKLVLRSFVLVICCFLLINIFILFVLKRFFIRPIRGITESLADDHQELRKVAEKFGIEEIQRMANAMSNAFDAVARYQSEAKQLEYEAKMGKLASQVAHDIRSPLAALNAATSLISALPENNRLLIRRAVQRIDDIANELISRSRRTPENESDNAEEACEVHLISGLIETIVSEKRLQFRTLKDVDIDFQMQTSNYGLFAQVNPIAIKRILSNLINNSMEALEFGDGRIYVKLFGQDRDLIIEVSDNGKGIPEHVLPLLMKEGASFGKKKGTGLGLCHANRTIQMWNGRIEIESQINVGAQVRIFLPRSPEPEWFVQELQLPQAGTVVILDDDDSIHEIWKGRFNEVDLKGLEILHFKNPFEVIDWYASNRKNGHSIVYLFDHELIGFDLTGLAVAAQLGICDDTILVTSRFDEESVRQTCISKNVRMIPKALAGFVPIQKKADNDSMIAGADYILIDDNRITRDNWEMTAQVVGTKVATYDHPAAFMKVIDLVAKDSKIYVDAHLSDGLRGEDVTRELHHKGFRNIYLATGSHPSEFNGLWWVKAITGKDPPFLKLAGKI